MKARKKEKKKQKQRRKKENKDKINERQMKEGKFIYRWRVNFFKVLWNVDEKINKWKKRVKTGEE